MKNDAQRDAVVGAAEEGEEDVVGLVGDGEDGDVGLVADGDGGFGALELGAVDGLGDAAEAVVDEDACVADGGGFLEGLADEVEMGEGFEALVGVGCDGEGLVFGHGAAFAPGDQGEVGGDFVGLGHEGFGVGVGGDDGDAARDGDVVELGEGAEGIDHGVAERVKVFAFGEVHDG